MLPVWPKGPGSIPKVAVSPVEDTDGKSTYQFPAYVSPKVIKFET